MIRAIVKIIRQIWAIRFLRFLVVGGINTVFGYSVFAGLILLNLHYVFAALLGQICGTLFNFKTTGFIVFKNTNNRLIFRFAGVYIVTYFLNVGLLRLFELGGVSNIVAGAIIILPVACVSYTLNRLFVFRTT